MTRLKVWDIPVRLFHWSLVVLVGLSFYTMKTEGAPFVFPIEIHARAGYLLVGLLLFRWLWGLWGSPHARFTSFLYPPGRMLDYGRRLLRGKPPHYAGHNPLGGAMVLLMLISLTFQAASGLFLTDDIFFDAPLHGWASSGIVKSLASLHSLNADLLVVLIAAHLMALLLHRFKGERLVSAMITGRKAFDGRPEDEPAEGLKPRFRNDRIAILPLALVVLALSSLPVIWLWSA
ncbi:cytochrome b/b6 domain-containing protein [Halomonas sp. KAO]|uniref:cytochrome b/b6 domain-containing protein n=1 Tax=unclassified Halomonas TaxID=2609666 RepID=UPI00189F990A|nr:MULTISPECIES: cytochrome b/b6 domain-containing protein [unclassified Halomonas]MBF7052407.1 cytochrome b/b6 domain-containing protein [Halomonas sp. KAO]MDT0499848.1 cytochrome b/b6 domain-containing protein [Halomonas sp. PAR7]MDT0510335.1 cytochrome b/b6 domain-containing protein [Halomonas sp. LES1]MDT0589956.1 cytochrome b/b6 domain-containing protein [Halomonas sp. PAR8]